MIKHRDARKVVGVRALRYDTWPDLQRAVRTRCRQLIATEDPTFDIPAFEADLHHSVKNWALDDEARNRLSELLDASTQASEFLETHLLAPEQSVFAAMIAGVLGARCEGGDGNFSWSIRDRLRCWGVAPDDVRWPLGPGARGRLVSIYERPMSGILWCRDRSPEVRDLAVITLLAGQWPDAARKQQAEGFGATRPTVMGVIGAEENAIRALWSIRAARQARSTCT